jgi:hypothetical protein
MDATSTCEGKPSGQVRYTIAPTPAYGKQNRRRGACRFGFGKTNQSEVGFSLVIGDDVIIAMQSYSYEPILMFAAGPSRLSGTGENGYQEGNKQFLSMVFASTISLKPFSPARGHGWEGSAWETQVYCCFGYASPRR